MPIDRKAIKAAARERLRFAVPRPYHAGLIFVLVAGILTGLGAAFFLTRVNWDAYADAIKYMFDYAAAASVDPDLTQEAVTPGLLDRLEKAVGPVSGLDQIIIYLLNLLRGIVGVGLTIFAMNTVRQRDASLGNLLDGFGRFFPLLVLLVLTRFLVTLWSYLLLIPGIIAFYRYRLSVYLMLDNPQLNVFHCILLSGRMMQGHKGQLFLLDLSFLGWALLAALPLSIGPAFGLPGLIAGGLGSAAILAWLLPYFEMSCVGFYEAVKVPVYSEPPDMNL